MSSDGPRSHRYHWCRYRDSAELRSIYFASLVYFEIFFFRAFHSSDAACMPAAVCVFLITFSLSSLSFFFNQGKRELHPNDLAISKSLEASGRIYVYRKDLADTLVRTFSLALETHRHRGQTENILASVL